MIFSRRKIAPGRGEGWKIGRMEDWKDGRVEGWNRVGSVGAGSLYSPGKIEKYPIGAASYC
jgi:hypothetical protein